MQDVTAAVIYNDGKVLLTRRAPGEKHAGWWEFPGGKIEDGETPEHCLQRELMEELGIDTAVGALAAESIFAYDTGSIRLLAYQAEIISGQLTLHVHDEYRWVDPSQLFTFRLLPADKPIAEKLRETDTYNKIDKA